jgi:hypothetical protein
MTATLVNTEQRLAQIRETGHWRVIIHPTIFEEQRIPTLTDCWRIVEESGISLRGWPYPYVNRDERVLGDTWVQSGISWGNEVELWRFYQSGQFVHHFGVREDREPPALDWQGHGATPITQGSRSLSYLNALYTLTEILLFARGLAYREVLEPTAIIRVELHGVKGRRLTAPAERWLGDRHERYASHTDTICWTSEIPTLALLADAPAIALDAAIQIFTRFGWENPSRKTLEWDQQRFLERSL